MYFEMRFFENFGNSTFNRIATANRVMSKEVCNRGLTDLPNIFFFGGGGGGHPVPASLQRHLNDTLYVLQTYFRIIQ